MNNKALGISEVLNNRIDKFLNFGQFEVIFIDDDFKGIGLKWGEATRLKKLGFKKEEQIFLLDQIEKDILNKHLCPYCFSRKLKAIDYKGFHIVCESCDKSVLRGGS